MRINLITPFSEKDQVKALGARWDAGKKLWYIQNVADLEPFRRWLPKQSDIDAASSFAPVAATSPAPFAVMTPAPVAAGVGSDSTDIAERGRADCGCVVLPWDDCIHTNSAYSGQ